MLELQTYDAEAFKNELKEARVLKTSRSAAIDKLYKGNYSGAKERAHEINERLLRLYSTKTFPVRIGSIVIDYKIFHSLIKKLKGYETELTLTDYSLRLRYWKTGNKGILELLDIQSYFEGFQHIPRAVLKNGQEE
ncbi:hypothetical protein [Cytobacillus oceanisediminis]|uniref:hypothetical protein n=1 Tax=Cytobacillus oceanisediminis TaxID=665099 RepID=UPI0025518FA7|nr:hypothetical protein [Cytobacillus oceanisediminis]MDK7664370.1 hypothetical protein [Cytobacillus oceanisediminis]